MKTTNYDLFSFMQENRPINNGLVNRIIQSIKDIGYIESRPIIVNDSLVIIDGQHRFHACKKLNLPIFYEISDADMNKAMIALNMNQMIWRIEEYIGSWAKSGIDCYVYLYEFEKKHKIGVSNSVAIVGGTGLRPDQIRSGKPFNINKNSEEIAYFILRCKQFLPFALTKPFVTSITVLFKKVDSKEINKVYDKMQSLKKQATMTDYLVCYENILNKYKKNNETRISLTFI